MGMHEQTENNSNFSEFIKGEYDITTSDSSIATVNGLTLTAHNSGIFSVIYTLKGTNISTSVEFSVDGTVEEEKPEPKNISECTFALSKTEYTYSGKKCEPTKDFFYRLFIVIRNYCKQSKQIFFFKGRYFV